MFDKILIANRGEIACRVIKTARRMGIRSVAVYSEADVGARHVRLADEAVLLGPAPARESYLAVDRIVAACRQTGAQAVHPGYGFLAENADFADACAAGGIVFIGPPAAAIRAMGSKSEARKLMEKAGVPLTPGYHGDEQAADFLRAQADAIGYPVLIKAAAGGGGKGMRAVACAEDFAAALASCRREAQAAFGDEHVLIEKYLQPARHIEIQVFGDTQGNVIHLFERDCSVQRRHQKVLEEAPAPGMTPARRAALGQAAVAAAQAVGYVGAGTVEFLVAPDGAFHFMEMNTRLQVEHPVTEMITGLDLVEWQLRVAAGEPLPLAQEQLAIRGHALEARIYAEDPDKGFLPSAGRLVHLAPPEESPHVRVDSGVEQGDAIAPHYDPMISKLIVWDETRARALARMRQALAQYRIAGVANNVGFLARLVACPAFAAADLDTGLIEREQDFLFPRGDAARTAADPHSPWRLRDGWRMNSAARRELTFRAGATGKSIAVAYRAEGSGFALEADGQASTAGGCDASLTAPMPGKVVALLAERGARVEKGAPLLILEAMKMEHTIAAPAAGTVKTFRCGVGDQVAEGAELVEFEAG